MQIHVKLFAILRDRAGVAEISLNLPDHGTVESAIAELARSVPAIAEFLPGVAPAVNREYTARTITLRDGDELALIPPVSGG